MYIRNSGQVGIGTTSPGYPLEVSGSTNLTEAYNWLGGGSGGSGTFNHNVSAKFSNEIYASAFDSPSDRRLKKDIEDLGENRALAFIKGSRPVKFTWKDSGERQYGFIAQDLLKLGLPELIVPMKDENNELLTESMDETGMINPKGVKLTVNYDQLTSLITQAVKYLYTGYERLRILVQTHDADLQTLRSRIAQIEEENSKMRTYLCTKDPAAPFCKEVFQISPIE